MRSAILTILALILIALPAAAGTGLTPDLVSPGLGFDNISGPGFNIDVVPVQIQSAYVFPLANSWSAVTAYRILAAPGNANDDTGYVNEFSLVLGKSVSRSVNVFGGGLYSLWGHGFTQQREQLYGGFGGMTFDMDDRTAFVVGYRYAQSGDLKQSGFVFGPTFSVGGA